MSTTKVRGNDMNLELVVVPASDVDRAKGFYEIVPTSRPPATSSAVAASR
jgi:hypothetical protein